MPILYTAAMWVNKDKPGEHIHMLNVFATKEEADLFLSQTDSDDYIILEMDSDDWDKMREKLKQLKQDEQGRSS